MHLQPARAERARPAAVRSEPVERRTSARARSEGSEPSGALSSERWGWGPTALSEERGDH